MQRSKSLALMFLLGAVLVGGALGFTADRMMVRDRLCPRPGDQTAMRDRVAGELGLDGRQRLAFDSILTERNRVVDSILQPLKPQTDSVVLQARARIRAMLTPVQQTRFDAWRKEMDANKKASEKH